MDVDTTFSMDFPKGPGPFAPRGGKSSMDSAGWHMRPGIPNSRCWTFSKIQVLVI